MKIRLLIISILFFPLVTTSAAETADAETVVLEKDVNGSYFALIVSDVDGSSGWYKAVLGLEHVSRSTEAGRYDIINLIGPNIFVELLQLPHAGARPGGQTQGPFKVGMLVEDIERFAAKLPAAVSPANIIFDEVNNLLVLQLRDPDNNTVQVMQLLEE